MTLTDEPAAYAVESSMVTFASDRVIEVRSDVVRMPDGATATRDVVVHPGAVGIIALDDEGRVLLVRQYRHPVQRMLWEPPAGLLDQAGESALATAQRELFEETHHRARDWAVLVDAFTSPGMAAEAVRIFLAREVTEASDDERFEAEHEERDMQVAWVPLEEVVTAILDGRVHNPLAIMGVLAVERARRDGFAGLRPADAAWPERAAR